ncbi:MAG: HAD family hydrolase [Pseudomonadota bacterium]
MRHPFVVFDWDGTLMDSAGKIVECLQHAIEVTGLPPREEAALRHIIGLGMEEAIASLYPGGEVQRSDYPRMAAAYREAFMDSRGTPSPLYPGVETLLESLEDAGYTIAVATGKSRDGLDHILDQVGMAGRFHATRTADETASKPHPKMLLELMEEGGFDPAQTVMVGDTEFDLKMAHAARVAPVAVTGGAHDPEHLRRFDPRVMLDDIRHLEAWLNRELTD